MSKLNLNLKLNKTRDLNPLKPTAGYLHDSYLFFLSTFLRRAVGFVLKTIYIMKKSVETLVTVYYSELKQCFYSHTLKEHSPTDDFKPFVQCQPTDFNEFLLCLPEKEIQDQISLYEITNFLSAFIEDKQNSNDAQFFNVA